MGDYYSIDAFLAENQVYVLDLKETKASNES